MVNDQLTGHRVILEWGYSEHDDIDTPYLHGFRESNRVLGIISIR